MSLIVRLVLIACLVFPSLASARVKLTEPVLDNLIESIQSLETWSEENKQKSQRLDDMDKGIESMSSAQMISDIKRAGVYNDISSLVKKHGFDSVEQWANVFERAMKAMMASVMTEQAARFKSQMNAQMEQIMNNPNLSKEQKQAMMQMMEQSRSIMQYGDDADPQDVADVRPYIDKFKAEMMKEADEDQHKQ
ncbi:MAG: hypothetical protein CSB48_10430 [Proteobacteria bacterium]|nr:MAG: hypothetical protein CSB48_10430 [Pseudomonadota bacterium]